MQGKVTEGQIGLFDLSNKEETETVIDLEVEANASASFSVDDKTKAEYLQMVLLARSPIQNGNERIYSFFKDGDKTGSAYAGFLKNEYGTGGRTFNFPDSSGYVEYNSNGIFIRPHYILDKSTEIHYPWIQVALGVQKLIQAGEYPIKLSPIGFEPSRITPPNRDIFLTIFRQSSGELNEYGISRQFPRFRAAHYNFYKEENINGRLNENHANYQFN